MSSASPWRQAKASACTKPDELISKAPRQTGRLPPGTWNARRRSVMASSTTRAVRDGGANARAPRSKLSSVRIRRRSEKPAGRSFVRNTEAEPKSKTSSRSSRDRMNRRRCARKQTQMRIRKEAFEVDPIHELPSSGCSSLSNEPPERMGTNTRRRASAGSRQVFDVAHENVDIGRIQQAILAATRDR